MCPRGEMVDTKDLKSLPAKDRNFQLIRVMAEGTNKIITMSRNPVLEIKF